MMDITTQKRLGQYFSGNKVAGLLVRLCSPTSEDYVIDPMAGIGDMLAAVIQSGVLDKNTNGIEIDPDAGSRCKERISPRNIYIGDAFSQKPYISFNRKVWDLVITNPPYVRYQTMGGYEKDGVCLKGAKETRKCLSALVDEISHLDNDEKSCFQRIIQNYSGLSDLAVPAWILCAVLTRVGGQIAMVVPESWISRDYALSIRYMLLKFFDIKYIVEDLNSAWFPGVLVKTNLLVAKRVHYRESIDEIDDSIYKRIRLSAKLIGENSLIEKLTIKGKTGYAALNDLLNSHCDISGEGYEVRNTRRNTFLSEMFASQACKNFLKKLEPSRKSFVHTSIPMELQQVIDDNVASTKLTSIEAWGIRVGQGLRTGANRFFYTELSANDGNTDFLVTNKLFNKRIIPVAQKYSLPALRYQNDAHGEIVISRPMLPHRLLYIQEDLYNSESHIRDSKDTPLVEHIAIAENIAIESNGRLTHFPELSAVKPNIRSSEDSGGLMRRWFMLPALTNRHTPQLCVSRVNYKNARCCLIVDEGIVVDANFSTLWTETGEQKQVYAVFALLNSIWVQSYLETIATIMGGGALKVEASHIRNVLLPIPTDALITSLAYLGRKLAEIPSSKNDSILFEIDCAVLQSLLGKSNIHEKRAALQTYLQLKVDTRQR